MNDQDFTDWLPIRLVRERGEVLVDWCYRGDERFKDPFAEQTIERCLRRPFALLFRRQTSLAELCDWHERSPGVAPTGLIFHMSRCGSTLVSQMLAALPQNIVLPEPPVIDALLRLESGERPIESKERCRWLRAMVSALGQPRGDERHLFIKLDSWHTLLLPLIRQAFPHTPWIFLYRDPVEVIVSHMERRGAQMVPGMLGLDLLGLGPEAAALLAPEEYVARVLGRFLEGAVAAIGKSEPMPQERGRLLHYCELPEAVGNTLANHFGIEFSAADLEQMREKAQFNAKEPSLYFSADGAAKQQSASDAIRAAAARWTEPHYAELERMRGATSRQARIP